MIVAFDTMLASLFVPIVSCSLINGLLDNVCPKHLILNNLHFSTELCMFSPSSPIQLIVKLITSAIDLLS